ncbi:glycoprotein-N-acetylgalactosamine 3-beta-galactosyltransferase 1 isoform X1 [Drosophila mojavensis]|nr:glycoprotein-N-acetylgalactosamine 3-beta-galactosyltransferase 1 isoform X1 [Drosophila mojavensis]
MVKLKSGQLHLFTGFVTGFVCAFMLILNIYDVHIDISCWSTSSSSDCSTSTAAHRFERDLAPDIRVLCMVLTCPENVELKAQHVHATWGKRCNKLIFVSSENYEPLGVVKVVEPHAGSYTDLWDKTREGFRYVWREYGDQYDWFVKADDDTYIIMENMRRMLSVYDPAMPLYFGYQMKRYNVSYMSGGASYVLSREALHRFMSEAYSSEKICPAVKEWGIEDFYMGVCLQNVGVHFIDSQRALPEENKTKFFPLDVGEFVSTNNDSIPDWLPQMSVSRIETGKDCCSNYSIAFHYITPGRMYLFDFLLYHLRIFGRNYEEQQPARLTNDEVLERFPLENNSEIRDLTNMLNKPANF